ncbi:MAG: NAD(P)H-dependent oxidoreductase, partial [Bdellovibrionota bacterium]
AADWQTLKHSLVKAPSSYGLQPWKFLVVETPALREKLKPASWGQTQITDASHLVVLLARDSVGEEDVARYIQRIAQVRGVAADTLSGFRDMMIGTFTKNMPKEKHLGWAQRQAYIAMGFLLESAALLRIDATPMEGFDPAAYDQILGLEGKGWRSTAVVALGYRHKDDSYQDLKKVRYAEADVIETR